MCIDASWLLSPPVNAPIYYAFPVRSMQQVHLKLHAEAAKLKHARIWCVRISPQAVRSPQCSTSSHGGRSFGVGSDGMGENAVQALIVSYRDTLYDYSWLRYSVSLLYSISDVY